MKGVFALDLGTTKFVLASLRTATGRPHPTVETVSVAADGMRRGMLANVDKAKIALQTLIERAEKHFGEDIGKVVVGVAGSHLAGRLVTVTATLKGRTVDIADVKSLVELAEAEPLGDGRELLHAVPLRYRLDQRDSVDDPIGLSGRIISADFFLIDADKLYLKDMVELCNACGLQVVRLYSEPFASASVTVPDAHKQLGVALCDIGGGTTDGLVFSAGRPVATFTVNIAGKLMTNDLAIGLNLTPDDAEMVKIRFGIKPRAEDSLELSDLRGLQRVVHGAHVQPILLPRIHELCAHVAKALAPFKGSLGGGILLTGGGADVKGIAEYFEAKLSVPVARARPWLHAEGWTGDAATLNPVQASPHPAKHATVVGLLNLELGRQGEEQKNRKNTWTNRYLGPLMNWLRELS